MSNYTDNERKNDFDFFIKNYKELYKKYGHKFLAIKNKEILGSYESVTEALGVCGKSCVSNIWQHSTRRKLQV